MEPAATVTGWTRALPAKGTARLRTGLRDTRDRLIASDPGLGRLRQGLRAVLAVGTTVLVERLYAQALGAPAILALLMGAIVAMLAATSVNEQTRTATVLTMGGVPLAASMGAVLGVVTSVNHLLGLTTFVVVSFVAVWVRRFGPRWFTYGFLAWQGFFFALFLHPPMTAVPYLVGAIVVASLWVGLLLLTLLRGDPQVRLRRTVQALRARARAGISVMIEVLDEPEATGPRRRLRGQLVQLSEIALLMDGQLADPRALPAGVRPGQVRRWAVDIEIAMDEAAGAVVELARAKQEQNLPAQLCSDIRQLLHALGWAESSRAKEWVAALDRSDTPGALGATAVRRLVWAAEDLLQLVKRWDTGELEDAAGWAVNADDPLDVAEIPFESVVTLFGGNLPGSAAVASTVGERTADRSRWSPSTWALSTRQAVQAAVAAGLAIVAGETISSQRYYWAVIAAFIAFTGASNAGETVRRSLARVAGTLAGLVGAIGLAHLTTGHQVATVVGLFSCIFLAFYLQQLSYAAMIFFITLMLGQMYTLLHTFTDAVLVLRLEETAAGAAIGVAVSLLVLPTGTRATARAARAGFFGQLADLLQGCADHLRLDPGADLLALTVGLDAWARQVVQTYRAVTRGGLIRVDRGTVRHRLSFVGVCGAQGRALASVVTEAGLSNAVLAAACEDLAAQARSLAEVGALPASGELAAAVAEARERVSSLVSSAGTQDATQPQVESASIAIGRLAEALALVTAR